MQVRVTVRVQAKGYTVLLVKQKPVHKIINSNNKNILNISLTFYRKNEHYFTFSQDFNRYKYNVKITIQASSSFGERSLIVLVMFLIYDYKKSFQRFFKNRFREISTLWSEIVRFKTIFSLQLAL